MAWKQNIYFFKYIINGYKIQDTEYNHIWQAATFKIFYQDRKKIKFQHFVKAKTSWIGLVQYLAAHCWTSGNLDQIKKNFLLHFQEIRGYKHDIDQIYVFTDRSFNL